ncbi:hypothetical protein ABPG74_018392 [Tetrahymena malaccensis]
MTNKLIGKLVFLLLIEVAFGQRLKSSNSFISKKSQLQQDFQKFKKTYSKSYDSHEHESYRFNVFIENLKESERLNKEIPSAKFGVTKFSDYTKEEFQSIYFKNDILSNIETFDSYLQNTSSSDSQVEVEQSLPDKWDIRINGPGKMQPVEDQGHCGSCWAFAITSTVENLYSSKKKQNLNFSEQQLIDCFNSDLHGCDGGFFTLGYDYVQKTGLTTIDKYPYIGQYDDCHEKSAGQLYKINGYVHLPDKANALKRALVQNGAIAVAVDSRFWQNYQNGIITDSNLGWNASLKAATLIGYGRNYWLIRNTWGSDWGEDGHIRVTNQSYGTMFLEYSYQPYL